MSDDSVRPWGHYDVLSDGADFKVKTITVQPGKRLSYQRHERRAEHWFVVAGSGELTLDDEVLAVSAGSSIDIAIGVAHRIANTSADQELVFVEVQTGDYFGEDDIERLDDDFGRCEATAS